jgi:hypothetical protein
LNKALLLSREVEGQALRNLDNQPQWYGANSCRYNLEDERRSERMLEPLLVDQERFFLFKEEV